MKVNREQTANLLFTAALVGVTVLSTNQLIAGLGINLASSLTQIGLAYTCRRCLGEDGPLDHDLQEALRRAFFQAVEALKKEYSTKPQFNKLKSENEDLARLTLGYFDRLGQNADVFFTSIFTTDAGGRLTEDEQVKKLLYADDEKIRQAVFQYLSDLFYSAQATQSVVNRTPLYGADDDLLTFLKQNLIDRWVFWFNQELKGEKPENQRARWAFERLVWESWRVDMKADLEKIYQLTEQALTISTDPRIGSEGLLEYHAFFAGRREQMARIQEFLEDNTSNYLFVTGHSGYGKTALLAQWARPDVVYHFISPRVEGGDTEAAFLNSLCQQLATRHGLSGRLPETAPRLRPLYLKLLQLPPVPGKQVVVLIDGLDEAAWKLDAAYFPRKLPLGVKVIFSARPVADRDWLSYLGLSNTVPVVTLGTMTEEDVKLLLQAAGGKAAPVANDPVRLEEVLHVSGGDPFYLKLLVEDIVQGDIQPNEINAQPRKLEEYLSNWYDQIAKQILTFQDVHDVLSTLAAAHGPLRRDDLISMYPKLGLKLRGVVAEVRRFLIGDDDAGYALCHPRFADYARQQAGGDLQNYRNSLLTYCRKWREHKSKYALRYYADHLEEADLWGELHTLVATGEERQDFAEARYEADANYLGYLNDLVLAEKHAVQEGETHREAVGRQVRYALIEASVNSLAGNIPTELLVALVREGKWDARAAAEYVSQTPNNVQRVRAWTQLARLLKERGEEELAREVRYAACVAITGIPEAAERGMALIGLAPDLDRTLLLWALSLVKQMWDASAVADTLAALVPHLPPDLLPEALSIARKLGSGDERVKALIALAHRPPPDEYPSIVKELAELGQTTGNTAILTALGSQLTPDQQRALLAAGLARVREGLASASHYSWESEYGRSPFLALLELAPHLPPDLRSEALTIARQAPDKRYMALALALLADGLADEERYPMLTEALEALTRRADPYTNEGPVAITVACIAARLPSDLLPKAVEVARSINSPEYRALALAALLANLPSDQQPTVLDEVLKAARDIYGRRERINSLVGLLPWIPSDYRLAVLAKALAAARVIGVTGRPDTRNRTKVLIALAPHLSIEQRLDVLPEALSLIREIENDDRATALAALAPLLPSPLWDEALEVARWIDSGSRRAQTLAVFAQSLPSDQRQPLLAEALAAVEAVSGYMRRECTGVLIQLAPQLPPDLLAETLRLAREVDGEPYRTEALVAVAHYMPLEQREAVLSEVFEAMREHLPYFSRVEIEALVALGPQLLPAQASQALTLVREICDVEVKATALTILAPRILSEERKSVLVEALATIREISRDSYYGGPRRTAELVIKLAPHLPSDLVEEALRVAREVQDKRYRAEVLAVFAQQMPRGRRRAMLDEALGVARAIPSQPYCVEALAALAPYYPGEQRLAILDEAVAIASRIDEIGKRVETLTALVPQLTTVDLISRAFTAACEVDGAGYRIKVFTAFAPFLPSELAVKAFQMARGIQDEGWRAETLAALAPRLPTDLHTEALAVARGIGLDPTQAYAYGRALATLVPHLLDTQRLSVLIEAMAAVHKIENAQERQYVLSQLAPYLPPSLLPEALDTTRVIGDGWNRAEALVVLVPFSPSDLRSALVAEAFNTAREASVKYDQAMPIVALAPYLSHDQLETALQTAQKLDEEQRAGTLTALAPRLPPTLLSRALDLTQSLYTEGHRAEALIALAPRVPPEALSRVLNMGRELQYEPYRAKVLSAILPHVEPRHRPPVLDEALAIVHKIFLADERVSALDSLAPHLPPDIALEALSVAQKDGDADYRSNARAILAPYLPEEQRLMVLTEALADIRRVLREQRSSSKLLRRARPRRSQDWRGALAWARRVPFHDVFKPEREWQQVVVFERLVPYLPTHLLEEALSIAGLMKHEDYRAKAIMALVRYLPPHLFPHALRTARRLRAADYRGLTLAAFVPYLTDDEGSKVAGEALDCLSTIADDVPSSWMAPISMLCQALANLAPCLTSDLLLPAVRVAQGIDLYRASRDKPAPAVTALAPHIPTDLVPEVWDFVQAVYSGSTRAHAMAALASRLPLNQRQMALSDALVAAQGITNRRERATALSAIVPRWAELSRAEAYTLWPVALFMSAEQHRVDLLSDLCTLVPMIDVLGGPESVVETFHTIQDVTGWWP